MRNGQHSGYVAELIDVTKRYGGPSGTAVLKGVSVGFARGTFTAVMGPSGSGKSTLLNCAAGLDRPDAGRVMLAGNDIGVLREPRLTIARRQHVGFVFQSFNLIPALTVVQNVLLPARLAGIRIQRHRLVEVVAQVGLAGRENARPIELSGGQQQRVAIARALVARPDLVFGDEPTGALDIATGREVLGLLRHAVDALGATIVMVTHDPAAAAWADRVVFLADGRVVDDVTGLDAQSVAARMTELGRR